VFKRWGLVGEKRFGDEKLEKGSRQQRGKGSDFKGSVKCDRVQLGSAEWVDRNKKSTTKKKGGGSIIEGQSWPKKGIHPESFNCKRHPV